jgi:hypothetical protein
MKTLRTHAHLTVQLALLLALLAPVARAAETGRKFASPEAAVAALAQAVSTTNRDELRVIFGPSSGDLLNPDPVLAAKEFANFANALAQTNHLVQTSDSQRTLELGEQAWPFPVPLVQTNGQWFFDTDAGKDEIINRRIGRDELETLKAMRAYVQAQREYASLDRDGDGVLEYAQKIISSPGQKDGLYWPLELDGQMSPLGPLVAEAELAGYHKADRSPDLPPAPFEGYFFKVLTRQGKNAPGGKYDYIINGNMIGGFALLAWPAEYGDSGIMTFVVNQQGRVYQKDLGAKTASIAAGIKAYDPDKTWSLSHD